MTAVVDAVRDHPWVDSVRWSGTSLVVRPHPRAVAAWPEPGPLVTEHLQHWQHVYSYVYAVGADRHRDDLDLSGWRASDTGEPFPREHMTEWIDHAVSLVLRNDPRVVLEVGCGTGLLLHRIHRRTRTYVGLDPAEPAVKRLREQNLPGVHVLQAAAHDLTSPAVSAELDGPPDCVVLNSVTQCFPNEEYLTGVVNAALDLVADGGTVVVGDVRSLAAAPAYAEWLERRRDPAVADADLAARIAARIEAEEELLCDPAVFRRIAARHPRRARADHIAKPLRFDSELTRYRYDMVLTIGQRAPQHQPGGDGCNDPFARFLRRRLPEVLADHLERLGFDSLPDIAVAVESTR